MKHLMEAYGKTCKLLDLRGYCPFPKKGILKHKINKDYSINLCYETLRVDLFYRTAPCGAFNPYSGFSLFGGETDFIKALDSEIEKYQKSTKTLH